MPDLDSILASAPSGEEGLVVLADGSARVLVETIGCESCEIWLWRRGADGEPRLVRMGAEGPPIPEAMSDESVRQIGDRALEGAGISTLGDHEIGARVVQTPLGLHGHALIALGGAPINDAWLDWLRDASDDLADAIATRLPHDELVEMNRWLLKRNDIDRRVARSFAKVRTLEELGRTIDEVADKLFVVEYSGIYFLDPESGQLRLVHAKGLTEQERVAAERTAEARHPGFVMRTGRVVDVGDTSGHPPTVDEEPPSHGKHIRSRMYLPVRVDGVVIGTVGFASTRPASYSARHRQGLAFLADFAGLTYARIVSAHENERRGLLLVASYGATERLLGALDWRAAANSVLAMIGSALHAGTLALLELTPAPGETGASMPVEFTWQPVFGEPWTRGARLSDLTAAEREQLAAGHSVEVSFADAGDASMSRMETARMALPKIATLKPVMVEGALWGVLAHEQHPMRHRGLDLGDRAVLRSLANAFGLAISRERLDETLRQRQKMEAVGMLAAGIARDFNNLLWPILLYTEMLERSVQLDGRMQQMLKDIRTAARSASELVHQVLAISRRRERVVEIVHLESTLKAVTDLLRRSAPSSVEFSVEIDPEVGAVLGDADAIQQAVTNLGARAFEVLRGRAGKVSISATRASRANKRYAAIAVQDDGPGLDAHARSRLFEPYYEGEAGGRLSTDLGLSIVHRVVTEHDGIITVQSEPSRGTRFEMLIPAAVARAGMPTADGASNDGGLAARIPFEPAAVQPSSNDARAGETVLLVDDDLAVLEVERQMLESIGYAVAACSDPLEALDILANPMRSVSVLMTDLSMPGLTGIELAVKARAIRPTLRVVCCTGYGDEASERRALKAGVAAFIHKPIDLDALAATLRKAIDA
jgi:signal transduction histidine kinase/CheY-like chemotaxis protein/putative methionine-R-sulfoxide reductase with GAF domain